ncbi:MAG TPA: DUF2007 domain-containing protein [Ignavibacteria bacterium]|nr:DUF2007 domain-containing protein [Ignavibacteria bacterium]
MTTEQDKLDHQNAVTVFSSGNEAVISVVKSILDEANIKYLIKGEDVENLFGLGVIGTGFNPVTGPVEFQVMPENVKYAKELLKDVKDE